jgi:hypothetical protein
VQHCRDQRNPYEEPVGTVFTVNVQVMTHHTFAAETRYVSLPHMNRVVSTTTPRTKDWSLQAKVPVGRCDLFVNNRSGRSQSGLRLLLIDSRSCASTLNLSRGHTGETADARNAARRAVGDDVFATRNG